MVLFSTGFLELGRLGRIPVRAHWTILLGCLIWGNFEFRPYVWLAVIALILIHEFGHAFVVRLCGLRVLSVDVHGFGGLCTWNGSPTPLQRASIAFGGIWGQMVLLAGSLLSLQVLGPPTSLPGLEVSSVFIRTNLIMMVINAMPVPGLDGSEMWKLFPLLLKRFQQKRARAKFRVIDATPDELKEGLPPEMQKTLDAMWRDVKNKPNDLN